MKNKLPYEEAKLELVLIDALDVITTSEAMWDDGDDLDDKAWT